MSTFGRRLYLFRKAKGDTQDSLAESCGMERASIWRLEHDEHEPSIRTLKRLSGHFDCTMLELLGP